MLPEMTIRHSLMRGFPAAAFRGLLSLACGFSLGIGSYACISRALIAQTLDYTLLVDPFSWLEFLEWGIAGMAAMAGLQVLFARQASTLGDDGVCCSKLHLAALPLLLMIPVGLFEPGFPSLLVYIAALSLAAFRIVAAWPGPLLSERVSCPRYLAWAALFALLAFSIVYSYLLQARMYNSLILAWDWNVYMNVVDNTLKGKWFHSDLMDRNFLGQHFDLGMVLILSPFVWLVRSVHTLFAVNALALYIGGIGIYALARAKSCGRGESLALASVYILHPSLSALSVCLFYGFHDTNLVIPLVVFFFLALEKGWRKTAIALLVLSLTVKETVAIFWVFMGLALALDKPRRKLGIAISLGSVAYFLFVMKLAMPAFTSGARYEFIDVYYQNLGSSIFEIAISPFARPEAFWGQLFRIRNLYFLVLIGLPCWIAFVHRARLLLGCVGILLFVFVKDCDTTSNINSSYQSEALALLNVASVLGFASLAGLLGAAARSPLLAGLALSGLASRKSAHAALAGTLLAAALCFYFFGLGCSFGRNAWTEKYMNGPDFTQDVKRWEQHIPEGVPLSASARLSVHFLLRNTVRSLDLPPEDYVLLDLNDGLDPNVENWRRRLLLSERYSLLRCESFKKHTWLLFMRNSPSMQAPVPREVFNIPAEEWARLGAPVAANEFVSVKAFAPELPARLVREGFKPVTLLFRLERKPEADMVFDVMTRSEGSGVSCVRVPFAHGVVPAYMLEPGSAFKLETELPASGPASLAVEIMSFDKPDFSLPPF